MNKIITILGAIGQLLIALMAVREAIHLADSVDYVEDDSDDDYDDSDVEEEMN